MFRVGVGLLALFDEVFDVREVLLHSFLEELLGVSDIGFPCDRVDHFVDKNRFPADVVVEAVGATGASTVAIAVHEVEGLHVFGQFLRKVRLEDVSEVGESLVGHRESEPLEVVLVLQSLDGLVERLVPEV